MNNSVLQQLLNSYKEPMYVFDIEELKNRVKYLKNHLPSKLQLCYAVKANTFIMDDIEDDIERFEVCSPGEYEICKKKNINKEKIVISGIYKSSKMIEEMIKNNENVNCYTIESMQQFDFLKCLSKTSTIPVLIRLTSGNQFGIDEANLEEIIKNMNEYPNLKIKGIQYFSGTQKVSIKNINREIDYLDSVIEKLEDNFGYMPEELEYGGGFPVYYFKNSEFDEDEYLKEISEIINEMKFKGKIIIELGRSIVASCGKYFTKVVDLKINKNQNYAIVDGGMNHIVYYGQSMAMKTPKCEVFPKRDNENPVNWNICGALCTINDILIKQFSVSNLKIGDIIMFENTGAYCSTEGISLFLSRDLPMVLKLKNDKIETVREAVNTYNLNM